MSTKFLLVTLPFLAYANWYSPIDIEISTASLKCPAYKCATSSISIANNACGNYTSSTYYLKPCSSTTTTPLCNTTSLLCTAASPASILQSYPGEPCTTLSDCKYGTCIRNVCVGQKLTQSCTVHDQCDPGLRCSAGGLCSYQYKVGENGCRDFKDCVNWAGCNATTSSAVGVCVQYASVPNGQTVTDCTNGSSNLCITGACVKTGTWFGTIGICKEASISTVNLPLACSKDTDCLGTDGINIQISKCSCGYNGNGQSYCHPFIGDSVGVSLISTWVNALKNSGNCNTSRRATYECMKVAGYFEETLTS